MTEIQAFLGKDNINGKEQLQTPSKASQPANTHPNHFLIVALWTVTLVGAALSTSYWILLLFTSFGLPRAQLWLKIAQPIISACTLLIASDCLGASFSLSPQGLPGPVLFGIPFVWLSSTALSSGLFLVHGIFPAFQYTGEDSALVCLVGVVQILLLVGGCVVLIVKLACGGQRSNKWAEVIASVLAESEATQVQARQDAKDQVIEDWVFRAMKVSMWVGLLLGASAWGRVWLKFTLKPHQINISTVGAWNTWLHLVIAISLIVSTTSFLQLSRSERKAWLSFGLFFAASIIGSLSAVFNSINAHSAMVKSIALIDRDGLVFVLVLPVALVIFTLSIGWAGLQVLCPIIWMCDGGAQESTVQSVAIGDTSRVRRKDVDPDVDWQKVE